MEQKNLLLSYRIELCLMPHPEVATPCYHRGVGKAPKNRKVELPGNLPKTTPVKEPKTEMPFSLQYLNMFF